jgi:hypothetical protein
MYQADDSGWISAHVGEYEYTDTNDGDPLYFEEGWIKRDGKSFTSLCTMAGW